MNKEMFYMGIDGGGTRCRARLESSEGKLLGEGLSGSANVMRSNATARTSILDACERAIAAAGREIAKDQIWVGAGLAGANVPSALNTIKQWRHPFAGFEVISDLHAACIGAHSGDDGAVIICGTGSSGTRYENDTFTDIGGHGFMVGDIASGAWLGLQAIQHTLQVLDGIRTKDNLSQAVVSHIGSKTAIELVQECDDFMPKDYASLAPIVVSLVAEAGSHAEAIMAQATTYLQQLADRLVKGTSLPLGLIGGLSHVYRPYFAAHTQRQLVACTHSPEKGAIHFVKQQLQHEEIGA